jgi:hypothetical protein
MNFYEKDRLLSLKMLLNEVSTDTAITLSAKRLRLYLTNEEYDRYRKDLAFYEHEKAQGIEPHLNDEAEDYWRSFKSLYSRSGLARTKEQQQRIHNEAQDLFGVLENMNPAGRAFLREARTSDKRWSDPVGRTGWELLVLKDADELYPHLRHVKNFTQTQFLQGLIDAAKPPPPETEQSLADRRRLLMLAKHLNR